MDWNKELNKPTFYTRNSGRDIITLSEAGRMPKGDIIKLEDLKPSYLEYLIVKRLKASEDSFEYLDGTCYQGFEAAMEVMHKTREGRYFIGLETETLKIIEFAFFDGRIRY